MADMQSMLMGGLMNAGSARRKCKSARLPDGLRLTRERSNLGDHRVARPLDNCTHKISR